MKQDQTNHAGMESPRRIPVREYYAGNLPAFLNEAEEVILGHLTLKSDFAIEQTQTHAWREQIRILKLALADPRLNHLLSQGEVFFEYAIPRMGKRVDGLKPFTVATHTGMCTCLQI